MNERDLIRQVLEAEVLQKDRIPKPLHLALLFCPFSRI